MKQQLFLKNSSVFSRKNYYKHKNLTRSNTIGYLGQQSVTKKNIFMTLTQDRSVDATSEELRTFPVSIGSLGIKPNGLRTKMDKILQL
jgi:hypothetical protein